MKRLIILTGVSGAGRSTAAYVLEELKYRVIDNLPHELADSFIEAIIKDKAKRFDKSAITTNIIDARFLIDRLSKQKHIEYELIVLTANKEELLSRYKLTRHMHPLQASGYTLDEALDLEIKVETELRDQTKYFIDTTGKNASDLRKLLFNALDTKKSKARVLINFVSFGFKNGIPIDADLVFDVRMISNPYYIDELKKLTGKDAPVKAFLAAQNVTTATIKNVEDYLTFYLPEIGRENRGLIVVGIGCSGGQHRSVYIAEQLKEKYKDSYRVTVNHRDMKRRSR